ncbi:MAG: GPP34 family phosphoprotein [Nonomuraea sp.]|nr:GPP34 family phosphoprotein [Nonomuraea sp.]NUP66085.1 GPP34 family phosphoprotein [Nonomuraea sp.]NUP78257.1 GPP34 family phosphoprotein [Nonomuraea sp.]NUS07085.1 GPP34 family phosphoprotein [Nonomuraea sp.]NUT09609.1 GPP34 family phosphoprotein [Nonomuraea sp.]
MTVTIAEELLLLAYSEAEGKQLIGAMQLDPALGGAILAELAVAGRVELTGDKVTLKDPTPLGDDELDATLARIAEDGKARKPAWWVQRLQSGKLRRRLLTRLAESGVLAEERGKVLGIFPTTRWPEADPRVEADVRERVSAALAGAEPDMRTAVLIAITHAAKLDRKTFPDADRQRVKEIAKGEWAGEAVAKTIASINAAIAAGATAAAVAAASS